MDYLQLALVLKCNLSWISKKYTVSILAFFFLRTLTYSQTDPTLEGFWECRIDYECSWGWKDSHNSVLLSKGFGYVYRGSVFGGYLEISQSLGDNYNFEITGQDGCYRKGEMKKHIFAGREYLSGSWIAKGGNNAMWVSGLCCNGKIELYRDIKEKDTDKKSDKVKTEKKKEEVHYTTKVKLTAGKKFVLKNVLFKISSDEFLPSAYPELELLAEALKENPNTIIQLEGHTDIAGPRHKNKQLSKKRVRQVKHYLLNNGISSHRIKLKWYGEKNPLIKYGTAEERSVNRRVEVKVLKV